MTEQKKSNELNEEKFRYNKNDYRERHQFWAGQTLTQFGNANNFFIIIGFAIFGYLVKELDEFTNIEFIGSWENINPEAAFLTISLIFILLSLMSGTLTMLSRLYDLRLTRHINTIRIKVYSYKYNYANDLPKDYLDIKEDLKFIKFQFRLFKNFWSSIIYNDYFLNDHEIENKSKRNDKFLELRKRTLMLGRFSWISFKWQILWALLAIINFAIFWK